MSGLELTRASIERALPDPPLSRLTGLRLSEAGLGMASAAMPASLWWQSGAGVFLAGTIAFVGDLPLGCAVLTGAPAGVAVTSSELSVNFLRPATIRSQSLIARARLIHSTRSLGLAEATIEDGRGRLLGHATSRCVLFPGNPAHMSARQYPQSSSMPDPYLREVEGDVRGQEFWDSTPGIEVMRQTAAGLFRPPVFLLVGLRGVEAREGELTLAVPISDWLCNAFGVVYGGVTALLADAAMSLAVGSTVPAATAFSPLDMKIHFLRPVFPVDGELRARARVVHRGRTIAVVTCDIVDPKERLVAQASGSVLILPGRPWLRPVHVADEMTQETDLQP
ncbi:MAG TPA: PaaI family thioesterase [Candidatus Limnocylindria bacterium]